MIPVQLYSHLNQSLQQADALMGIAEVHGLLCGLLCTSQNIAEPAWFEQIFQENAEENLSQQTCRKQLMLLKEYTATQLQAEEYPFNLLLPEEDSLMIRTEALATWCQGFLLGLGLTHPSKLTKELNELIRDMVAISHLSPPEQDTEADEIAYTELVEYVRIGVLTIYQEFTITESLLHG